MEEECFAPCKRAKKRTQAAREVRTSEPETPPEAPGDGPVGEKSVFRGTPRKAVLELQNGLPDAPGDFQKASG